MTEPKKGEWVKDRLSLLFWAAIVLVAIPVVMDRYERLERWWKAPDPDIEDAWISDCAKYSPIEQCEERWFILRIRRQCTESGKEWVGLSQTCVPKKH